MSRFGSARILPSLIPLALLACEPGGDSDSDDGPPPLAPTNLTLSLKTSGRIELVWTDNSDNETAFQMERSPDGVNGWAAVGATASNATFFADTGLTPLTTYHYRVRALNGGSPSAFTPSMSATTENLGWESGPAASGPSARQGHSAVYDPLNQRMVFFGGEDGAFQKDVWLLPLDSEDLQSQTWTEITPPISPTPTPPPFQGRSYHTAAYDPLGKRMVIFGGFTGLSLNNEVWFLSLPGPTDLGTPTWTFGPSGGPDPRLYHSAVYDEANRRMIVFGGSTGSGATSEVWELRLPLGQPAVWNQLGSAFSGTPIELQEHCAIYDQVNRRMIVYGGLRNSIPSENVYAAALPLGGGTPVWSLLTSTIPPAARSAAAAVYDAENQRMIVFGGYEDYFLPSLADVWALSLKGTPVWTSVSPGGTAAPGRAFSSGIYDPLWERMILFSGFEHDSSVFTFADDKVWPLKIR